MGTPYLSANKWVKEQSNSVFVEIGSERGEGSTSYLTKLAQENNTVLHTVDIIPQDLNIPGLICHTATGSEWCKTIFPALDKKISCLYLDNFDWDWNEANRPQWILEQIDQYRLKGIEMTNLNCQEEHYTQLVTLEPYFADHCVVIFDDTIISNGTWTGKSAPGVFYLTHRGFTIVEKVTGGLVLVK